MFNSKYKNEISRLERDLQKKEQQHQVELDSLQQQMHNLQQQLAQAQQDKQKQNDMLLQLLSGTALTETIRNSLADNAEHLSHKMSELQQVESMISNSHDTLALLTSRTSAVRAAADQSQDSVGTLQNSSAQVHRLIASIKEISDQTNLLALNAAIEAARAGEAGRGFAVVADEVRQLASKAHTASTQIEQLINAMQNQTKHIADRVQDTSDSSAAITQSVSDISTVIDRMSQCALHMHDVIHVSSQLSFLNTVKLDHVVWKNSVYNAIAAGQFHATVNKHTECRLGQWYFNGKGAQLYKDSSAFKAIDSPHKQVHEMGRAALAVAAQDLNKMNQQLTSMEHASVQVAHSIDQLIAEIQHNKLRKINAC